MTRVAIVGAGLAGLSAAHTALDRGHDVTVFEAADAPGGVVRSFTVAGCHFEAGPNTVPAVAELFRTYAVRFGLGDDLIASSDKSQARWVWFDGRLVRVPMKPPQLVKTSLFSLGAKLKIALEPFRRWKEPEGPEPSFGELLRERIGTQPTERLAAAFVRGIYAGDIDKLGAKSAFPRVWNALREHGSLIRFARAVEKAAATSDLPGPKLAPGRLLGIRGGLERLPRAMADALGARLHLGTPIRSIVRDDAGFTLETREGRHSFEHVILATPAPATAALLRTIAPASVLEFLDSIEHASLDVAHVVLDRTSLESVPAGFGFLIPPTEEARGAPTVLGTIYASNLFGGRAPENRFTVSMFLPPGTDTSLDNLGRILAAAHGWSRPPKILASRKHRWRDVIPQATVGHADRWRATEARLARELPGLSLAGTFTGGPAVEAVLSRGAAAMQCG